MTTFGDEETKDSSAKERASLVRRREGLAAQAIANANNGEFSKAQQLLEQVLDVESKLFGKDHAKLIDTLTFRAQLAHANRDWMDAIESRRRAFEMGKRMYPLDGYKVRDLELALDEAKLHLNRTVEERRLLKQADSANRQAASLYQKGRSAEAITFAQNATESYAKVVGKEHPHYGASLNNLATIYRFAGDFENAEPRYIEAIKIDEKVLGRRHPSYATSIGNLAGLYQAMGRYERAEPLCLEAKSVFEDVFGDKHPRYATSVNNLAALYEKMGHYVRAEKMYIEANEIYRNLFGKNHLS